MLVSILHRITGGGLAIVGAGILAWWLAAAASGAESYQTFIAWAGWQPWALIIWVPLSWAFFQHTLSGLRHFVMDIGAGYELSTNKFWSVMTLVLSVLLTASLWGWLYWKVMQ